MRILKISGLSVAPAFPSLQESFRIANYAKGERLLPRKIIGVVQNRSKSTLRDMNRKF